MLSLVGGIVKMVISEIIQCGKILILLLCCLSLAACAPSGPFKHHISQPMPPVSGQQLLDNCWLTIGHRYLCRHSGLLEVFTRKIPLEGVVKVDTSKNEARLVAMDSMGVKLFDIAVTAASYQLNYLLPVLEEHPQLPQMVAKSVQHIFLAPYPQVDDQLERTASGYTLASPVSGAIFSFIGRPVRLNAKVVNKGKEQWQVNYYDYIEFAGAASGSGVATDATVKRGLWAPTGIVLDDDSGFSLTLWIQEIRELQ